MPKSDKTDKPVNVRPATREEILRETILLRDFLIVDHNQPIAQGYIVAVLNVDCVMVDLWRKENKEEITTHFYPLTQMTWDEFTQTGFMFGPKQDD